MKTLRFLSYLALCVFGQTIVLNGQASSPLTTLQYKIVGTQLKVSPIVLSVPKGIAGSVLVQLANADGSLVKMREAQNRQVGGTQVDPCAPLAHSLCCAGSRITDAVQNHLEFGG
jgi:hypothetical protein